MIRTTLPFSCIFTLSYRLSTTRIRACVNLNISFTFQKHRGPTTVTTATDL